MNDSYSAARVHVMRTKLIVPSQYERLLKMGEKEIIGFLQTTEYRKDVDAVALKDLNDLEMIDQVIAHNLKRELQKLRMVASTSYAVVLDALLSENDRWNLLLIAESITSGVDASSIIKRYGKTGTFEPLQFAAAKSIDELAKAASSKFGVLRKRPSTLVAFRDLLSQEGSVVRKKKTKAQRYHVDEENLLKLVMLKREKLSGQQIMLRLKRGGTIDRTALKEAANAATSEDALRALRNTKYSSVFAAATDQKGSMVRFEEELHAQVLKRVVRDSVSSPLHVQLLLRYLAEKEIEHSNIRLLIKGKRLGLEEQFLREHLVV
jgi:V/A-type H+-transporting ATPase subunit C